MEQHVLVWITQYGYLAIFLLLVLGIVGLPVPDETLLTFTGFLVYKGNFSLPLAFGAALAGSLCGITISYALGRTFGMKLVHRYGRYFHITEKHIEKAHAWFGRVGHWGLTFGYFIPGVRHISAYAAGMSAVEPPQFALFAYSGGCLWVSVFIGLATSSAIVGRRSRRISRDI
ncbi:MAG: DedA family protein [Ignavibacteriota bacterium]